MNTTIFELEAALAVKQAAWDERELADTRHREAHEKLMQLCKALPLKDGGNLVGSYVITKNPKPGFLENEYTVKKLNFIDPAFTDA